MNRRFGKTRHEIGPGLDPMGLGVGYYGALDSSRARTDLGWKPRFTLTQAVDHYLGAIQLLSASANSNN